MAGSKSRRRPPPPAPASAPPAAAPPAGRRWPAEFCSQRTFLIVMAVFALYSVALFSAAGANNLLWVKRLFLILFGLDNPSYLLPGAHSWDVAGVLWALGALLAAGILHPVFGIVVFSFFRHLNDGYTYPADNVYFVWGILVLWVLLALRLNHRKERLLLSAPFFLLLVFYLIALVVSPASVLPAATFTALLWWGAYILLFLLTLNSVRSPFAFNCLAVGLIFSVSVQAFYAVLQFQYILPGLRRLLLEDESLRMRWFGENSFSPELIRRFNINRAYGTMLFPNALAGFLILFLPFTAVSVFRAWRHDTAPPVAGARRERVVLLAGMVWGVAMAAALVWLTFSAGYATVPLGWYQQGFGMFFLAAALGALPAALVLPVGFNGGARAALRFIGIACGGTALLLQTLALLLTYSRAGMLGLALALVITGTLWIGLRLRARPNAIPLAMAAFFVACAAAAALGQGASQAQDPPANPVAETAAHKEMMESGVAVGVRDLADPASFYVRLTYWQVAVRMFFAHMWRGVGLDSFGVTYPAFQHLGDGDVRVAHNSYLQMFSETGLFGGIAFAACWAYILWWGARRILREPARDERLLLSGMFAGLLSFLLHAFLDIHFSNQSLAMYAMIMLGLFWHRAHFLSNTPLRTHRLVLVVPVLLVGCLIAGLCFKVWRQELSLSRVNWVNVGAEKPMGLYYSVGEELLKNLPTRKVKNEDARAQIQLGLLRLLVRDPAALAKLGPIAVELEDRPGSYRRLNPGETAPETAIVEVRKPWVAYEHALEGGKERIAELIRIDDILANDPQLAGHIADWCALMTAAPTLHPAFLATQRPYHELAVRWAREAVRRSPMDAALRSQYATRLWGYGNFIEGSGRLPYLKRALEEFKRASELAPTIPAYLRAYANPLRQLGDAKTSLFTEAERAEFRTQAAALQKQANELQQARWDLGFPQ